MFDSKKKREAARQQAGEELKQALDAQLDRHLRIEDPAERYLALLDFQIFLGNIIKAQEQNAEEKKYTACIWAGLTAASPISIAWIAMEPFTGVLHLLYTGLLGLTPALYVPALLKPTRIGDSHVKDAQVIIDQAYAFQHRAQEALETIAKNNLNDIAASPKASYLRHRSSLLDKAMAEAFSEAARKKLENPKPPKPKKEPGFNQ